MDKFTKLNLNGVDKFVSAIYDGSGKEIVSTYETKVDSESKQEAINQSISATNTNLSNLATRVAETEKYKATIDSNILRIQKNETDITALQQADATFEEDLGALRIQVGSDETSISKNESNIRELQVAIIPLQNGVAALNAQIGDSATGLNALNQQADKNTADIASVQGQVTALGTSCNAQYQDLLKRVEALETAMASYHTKEEEPAE